MAIIHISQAEAERNMPGLLARLDADTSFIIEGDSRPIAVLKAAPPPSLSLQERIDILRKEPEVLQDEDFAADVEFAINRHREPTDSTLTDENRG